MLELADLSRALAVSRSWFAAVRSMAPIHASIERYKRGSHRERKAWRPLPPIVRIAGSPLLRHLGAIQICKAGAFYTPLDNAALALVAQHAPNLQTLWCQLTLTPDAPLILPAQLRSLELQLDGESTDAVINGVLTLLAALPSLSRLGLRSSFKGDASLGLLAACPSLTDLQLESRNGWSPAFTDAQEEQVRSSLGHLQRFSVGGMEPHELAHFLRPPVTAQWQDIGFVFADERSGELLLGLPSLTTLCLVYRRDPAPMDFLPQLPKLTTLELHSYVDGDGGWIVPADALLASLLSCSGITELTLWCGFKSAHWSALFAKLTSIKKLTIRGGGIDSLACFAAGPITESLEELKLEYRALPPSELPHLYDLRRLRSLHLDGSFSSRLADAAIASFIPPTPILPALSKFGHSWDTDDGSDSVERRGSSFEWMQARQAQ